MAHLYSTHRVSSGRPSRGRRNFFDEEVEHAEVAKTKSLSEEIEFRKDYGHYFDSRDIKKYLHLKQTDPVAFEQAILNDPEVALRQQSYNHAEVRKQELILKGIENLKKWSEQAEAANYQMDDSNIDHFKCTDIDSITSFNDEFSRYSRTLTDSIEIQEDRQVEDHRNEVIKRRRQADLPVPVQTVAIERLSNTYSKQLEDFDSKVKDIPESDNKPINANVDLANTLERLKLQMKLEVVNDIIKNSSTEVDFGTQSWFANNKDKLQRYFDKYNMTKYRDNTFYYNREYKKHRFVFQPSGGGKSTLAKQFGAWVFDVDRLLDYELDNDKFRFLVGYSKFTGDWRVINNYWKELINMYEHKFRGRVLLCHGPSQLPVGMVDNSDLQCMIILPSVKRWDLREFKSNYDHLFSIRDKYYTIMLHYRYYFFNIYYYFGLEHNSGKNIYVK